MTIDNSSAAARRSPERAAAPSAPSERVSQQAEPALKLTSVTKYFPGVTALDGVDFECYAGEVHALVGENGSGKSTLIKVAAGVLVRESGDVRINGNRLRGGDPREARRQGLMTAYQDTSLIGELSVARNIEASFHNNGERPPADVGAAISSYRLPFGAGDLVKTLGPGARQMLEVVKALLHAPRVLILDEPTAALDMRTADQLQDLILKARDKGMAIVYVSHRLEEVRRLADRITVIRDGVIQGTHADMAWAVEDIVELMVGAPLELEFPRRARPALTSGAALLSVEDLEGASVGPVTIDVRPGEIVGVAGAEGSGQRDLLRAIIGIDRKSGSVTLNGTNLRATTPRQALKAGISYQSGDRAAESVFSTMSVLDNSTLQLGSLAGPAGLAFRRTLRSKYVQVSKDLGIVAASPYQPVGALSGGNQQKVVLSRPKLKQPKLLIVDEPCQGVDAKARLDIYRVITDAADAGVGVLLNSSDSSELAGLCDRVYVMADGLVIDELKGDITESAIVRRFVSADTKKDAEDKSSKVERRGSRIAGALVSPQVPALVLVAMIALLCVYTASRVPFFWSSFNITNLMVLGLPLICAAIGQQFALITAEFDISIGASMTVAVCVASAVLSDFAVVPMIRGLLLILAVGFGIGLVNAFLTRVLGVNPVVATIATMGILMGIAVLLRPLPGGSIAPGLGLELNKGIGFVPFVFPAVVAVAVALDVWLHRTGSGLSVRAVGLDAEASCRNGVRANRIKSAGYLAAAIGAVVGGFFLSTQVGIGSNDVALGLALPTFTACFLGGATLNGGRGTFMGAMLGAVFLTVLGNATQLLGVPYATSQLVYGGILLAAVAVYAIGARRV